MPESRVLRSNFRPKLSVTDLVALGDEPADDEAETRARLRADLFEAAKEGEEEEVEELLDAGALVDSVDGSGRTALMKAAAAGHANVVALLIERGAAVTKRDAGGAGALIWACEAEDEESAAEVGAALLGAASGLSPPLLDTADFAGLTPLMRAAELGRTDFAMWLLSQGADAKLRDESHFTAVFRSVAAGHADLARALVDAGAWCDLMSACALGDASHASSRLEEATAAAGATDGVGTLDEVDPQFGFTPLMVAAAEGHADLVRRLLAAGADPTLRDRESANAVLWACEFGHTTCAELLLDDGRSGLEEADEERTTPLLRSAARGHSSLCDTLLGRSANLRARDVCGRSALSIAAREGQLDVATLLIGKGAEVCAADAYGCQALHHCCAKGHAPLVAPLLAASAAVDAADANGETPLMVACEAGHVECVEALLGASAALNVRSSWGATPLSLAVENQRVDAVRAILASPAAGVALRVRAERRRTALMLAAMLPSPCGH